MLNYLKGKVITINKTSNNRLILILEVQQIGYEIQINSHLAQELEHKTIGTEQIYIHFQIKEDLPQLYGFASSMERDIFRQLIGVSGIGAQLASSLLDALGADQLIQAIVFEKIAILVRVPGVGKKTAERIILELKDKFIHFKSLELNDSSSRTEILSDLQITLETLGYENREIILAINKLTADENLLKVSQFEEWLKRAIFLLDS